MQLNFAIGSMLWACTFEVSNVVDSTPTYEEREELDFDKLNLRGYLSDPEPKAYDGVSRYYDTSGMVTSQITDEDVSIARSLIDIHVTEKSSVIQYWSSNRMYEITELDWAQVYALYQLMFTNRAPFEEKDLRLRSATEERIVSVRQEPNGVWKVSHSRVWEPKYRLVSKEEAIKRYRLASFEESGEAWTHEQVAIVVNALKVLEPRELKYLQDLTWLRKTGDSSTSLAGVFRFETVDGGVKQTITLYNKAFAGQSYSFCGSIEDPYSAAHVVIVHELAHLLADQPRIAYGVEFNRTVDEYNALVAHFNVTQDDTLLGQIDALQRKLTDMEDNPIKGDGPIVEAFLANRSNLKGPTKYADVNADEAFAESYALYKLDSDALKRIDPELYLWFESKAYLELLP